MIRRALKSQLTELEKRFAAAVAANRDEENAPARWAHFHAMGVAAVVLHGEPKIAEPLSLAQSRMQEKLDKQFAAAADEYWIRKDGQKRTLTSEGVSVTCSCLRLFLEPMTISSLNESSPRRRSGSCISLASNGMQSFWASNFPSWSGRLRWERKPGLIEIDGQGCLRELSLPEGHVRNRTNHGKEL
jgi:hypothetical protein